MTRKEFLELSAILGLGTLAGCKPETKSNSHITGKMVEDGSALGHKLHSAIEKKPSKTIHEKIMIAGGGVAGLSAAYHLKKNGITDFSLLEMGEQTGGNSLSGANHVSSYPWAAHYLPIPNLNQPELIDFLKDTGAIESIDKNGIPSYREDFLCFEPEERLFIRNRWQEGLIPDFSLGESDKRQIQKFVNEMEVLRLAKGKDGKDAFTIPAELSSADEEFRKLDRITFAQWLKENEYDSEPLLWYLEYCSRDDFGAGTERTSAWAGIHYFASRKGVASNAGSNEVLTWPEGNAWLTGKLAEAISDHRILNHLLFKIEEVGAGLELYVLDYKTDEVILIKTDRLILATPQFVNKRILKDIHEYQAPELDYYPWMVANITLKNFKGKNGAPMSWDNVIYGSKSLGYVNACHQKLQQVQDEIVLTYYQPLADESPSIERTKARDKKYNAWLKDILHDLKKPHPDISGNITNVDIRIWGHGMVHPAPGAIFSPELEKLKKPLNHRIHFAHSDLAGYSIFEEAFYYGVKAAKQVISFYA